MAAALGGHGCTVPIPTSTVKDPARIGLAHADESRTTRRRGACYPPRVLPRFRPAALLLFAVVFFASMLLGDRPLAGSLALDVTATIEGLQLWRPLTAPFVDLAVERGALLGCLVVCWVLGSPLEGFWGWKRFFGVVVGSAVAGYVLTVAIAMSLTSLLPGITPVPALAGSLPLEAVILAAFAKEFSRTPYQPLGLAPIRGWMLASILAVLLIARPLLQGESPWALVPAALATLVALPFIYRPWRRPGRSGKVAASSARPRGHLRLVHDVDRLPNRAALTSRERAARIVSRHPDHSHDPSPRHG
jgi:membrane associated rhomboid family serine protease